MIPSIAVLVLTLLAGVPAMAEQVHCSIGLALSFWTSAEACKAVIAAAQAMPASGNNAERVQRCVSTFDAVTHPGNR